jgi:hypothetical protein
MWEAFVVACGAAHTEFAGGNPNVSEALAFFTRDLAEARIPADGALILIAAMSPAISMSPAITNSFDPFMSYLSAIRA